MLFHDFKEFLNTRTYPVIVTFLMIIFLIYTFRFLSHPDLPHDMVSGWWGWWDQSQYIKSARALSRIDLSPAEHWYFPGYALLGAVFYKSMPVHAFYFVDAICFLVTALCFIRISRHFDIGAVAASAVFVFSTVLNSAVFEQFVVPWSTTPSCAIIYVILTLFLNRSTDTLKFFLTGLLASAVLIIRPTDVISTAPVFVFLAANATVGLLRRSRERIGNRPGDPAKSIPLVTLASLIAGGMAGLSCVLLIYYAIYGWSVSHYLNISQDIGFIFSALPIKLYVLFIDPAALYGQGKAILTAYPWIFLSLIGIVCCLLERSRLSIIAACVLVHIFFYACYADLLPTNIWHFNLIHYLKWTFPLLGLFAWLAVKTVLSGRRIGSTALAATGLIFLLSVRIDLELVDAAAGTVSPSGFQSSFADMGSIAAIDIPMMGGSPKGLNEWPVTLDADGHKPAPVCRVPVGSARLRAEDHPDPPCPCRDRRRCLRSRQRDDPDGQTADRPALQCRFRLALLASSLRMHGARCRLGLRTAGRRADRFPEWRQQHSLRHQGLEWAGGLGNMDRS